MVTIVLLRSIIIRILYFAHNNPNLFCFCIEFHFHPEESLANHAFSDNEYKQSLASGYTFFEILMPEELQYTYKISPAPFALPFNATFRDPIALVMSDPPCGCSYLRNFEEASTMIRRLTLFVTTNFD